MSQAPTVAVVVLNWNQADLTLRCLESVRNQDYQHATVLVVDNGSATGEHERLRVGLPEAVELLALPANQGFAGGMNRGIESALSSGAEFVWLLNNDAFPEPTCLTRLVEAVSGGSDVGAAAPALFDPDGTEQFSWAHIDWRTLEMHTHAASTRPGPRLGTWLSGTAPLLRASALRSVGTFDERFFAYMEEVELFLRFSRAGYRLAVAPTARCVHLQSGSTGGGFSPFSAFMITRNSHLFFRQYPSRHGRIARRVLLFANTLSDVYADAHQGRAAQASARLQGLAAGLRAETGSPARFDAGKKWCRYATVLIRRSPFRLIAWAQRFARSIARPRQPVN